MIVTRGLTKRYGTIPALSHMSLEVRQGEILGLLGPNGSGKTTMIRLLLGMLRPTAGEAEIAGFDCWEESLAVRRLVSYLPGELRLFGAMSGLGVLEFLSDLRGGEALDRAVAIAEQVMSLDLSRKVRTYSTGMKQNLPSPQGAPADPVEILILDEPTLGSSTPRPRQDVVDLRDRCPLASGQTIIFSGAQCSPRSSRWPTGWRSCGSAG